MKITLRDVAQRAGVSPITVSRAFSGTHPVSKGTRDRIIGIAKELGYAPDLLARSLVQKRSPIIGVIIPELANPFFIPIVDSIQTEARKREFMVVIAQSERQEDLERKNIDQFQQMRVAGAVITPVSSNLEHLHRLQAHFIKVIVVARQWRDGNYVTVDDFKGGYLVGKHLTKLGHRTIGCVSLNEPENSALQSRIKGFQTAIEEVAGACHQECLILTQTLHTDQGLQAADTLLELAEKPTAVFVTADHLAIGLVHRLLERGVRVPEDVAVVGYDDILYSEFLEVPLTTVALPKYEMGRIATQILFEIIEAGQENTELHQILLEPELVVRSSCGAKGTNTSSSTNQPALPRKTKINLKVGG